MTELNMARTSGDVAVKTDQASQEPESQTLGHREYCIIHDSVTVTRGALECQLERALEQGCSLIIVEPASLGDEIVRWIRFGNFLHKSAVLASLGALVLPIIPTKIGVYSAFPIGLFGLCCTGLYDFSWQFDPCCKYQVDYKGTQLTKVPSHELLCRSPVVLVRHNDKYRKRLHNALSLVVIGYLGWRLYQLLNS